MTATSDESTPPDRPMTTSVKPFLRDVVAGAEHERLVHLAAPAAAGRRRWRPAGVGGVVDPGRRRDVDHGQRRLGGPAPRVEQALAEDRLHLDVEDQRLLGELAGAGQQLAVGVEDHRRPVEDQLVLAADLVDVDEGARRRRPPGSPASARARRSRPA